MEIERKWLIKKDKIPYDLSTLESHEIEQFYISHEPTIRARKIDDVKYIMTIKTKASGIDGIARNEYEFQLCKQDYDNLFVKKDGSLIIKRRYIHYLDNGLKEEIDIFDGYLKGLAYLEIEFPDVYSAKAFETPIWVEKDVTYEDKYKNGALSIISDISSLL